VPDPGASAHEDESAEVGVGANDRSGFYDTPFGQRAPSRNRCRRVDKRGEPDPHRSHLVYKSAAKRRARPAHRCVTVGQFGHLIYPVYREAFQRLPAALRLHVLDEADRANTLNLGDHICDFHGERPRAEKQQRLLRVVHLSVLLLGNVSDCANPILLRRKARNASSQGRRHRDVISPASTSIVSGRQY
jgi:hypothetical protein